MAASIGGYILWSKDRLTTARFYEALGLTTNEHQHGGPYHFEVGPSSPHIVTEIYTMKSPGMGDALMVQVDSIDKALTAITPWFEGEVTFAGDEKFRYVYVLDPDMRRVMLFEKK